MRKLTILVVFLVGVIAAQEAVIRGGVALVDVLVTVRDKRGGLAKDLKQTDFKIFEDGKQQEIRGFGHETNVPLTVGMVVDVSGSVAEQVTSEKRAARQFFEQVLRPQDQAFVISFARQAVLLQDTTGSMEKLQDGLDEIAPDRYVQASPNVVMAQFPQPRFPMPSPPPRGRRPGQGKGQGGAIFFGGTVLHDAVFLASDEVLRPATGRKAIILITDGADQGSRVTLSRALEAAQSADVVIYSIQVRSAMGRIVEPLNRLSTETGGRVFKLDNNMSKIFTEISAELRSQYSLSYVSSNEARNGLYRKIEIKMANKDFKPQARKGYYAPRGE